MKATWVVLLMSVIATIAWFVGRWSVTPSHGAEAISYHTGVTIEQVQALSSLITAKVDVSDVQETKLQGHTGGLKAAILIKGDYLLGTDLSQAKLESVDRTARTAVLVLPQPRVTSPRLDHNRTRLFALTESGLWQFTPGDDGTTAVIINRAYQDAQRYVTEACNDPSLAVRSRHQAESVLKAFFEATGWRVTVRWEQ